MNGRSWGFNVSEGGLEPPCPLRALAPQASASAYSATRTRDARGTHRLSYLSKPNAPRRVPRPPNPAARGHAFPQPTPAPGSRSLASTTSSPPRGIPMAAWLSRRMTPTGPSRGRGGNASHISITSTVPRSTYVDHDDRSRGRTSWNRAFTASERLGLNGSLQQCRLVTLRGSRYAARGPGWGAWRGRPLLGLALDACRPGPQRSPGSRPARRAVAAGDAEQPGGRRGGPGTLRGAPAGR